MEISQSKSRITANGDKLRYIKNDRKSIVFKILVNSSIISATLSRKEAECLMHRLTKQILARLKNMTSELKKTSWKIHKGYVLDKLIHNNNGIKILRLAGQI